MGTDFSTVTGTGSLGVMVVAEASGEHEAREQRPLVEYAPSGSLFERTLQRMGLSRAQFAVTNCLRCRPRNDWLEGSPWEWEALAHCRPNLEATITSRRPKAILALGGVALRELTGLAGEARGVSHLAGYCLPSGRFKDFMPAPDAQPIPVIPAFHPAYIRRGKASLQGQFARCVARAVNVASGKDRDYIWDIEEAQRDGRLRYQTHPSLEDARNFLRYLVDNRGAVLAYDIETYESASLDEDARDGFQDTNIRLIQFSAGTSTGIALPWEGAYKEIAAQILATDNTKCGHNVWLFDNKVLEAAGRREGIELRPRGVVHDTLQMFHHWQPDLPAHLQFAAQWVQFPFPWKHLAGTDLPFYGCVDVDATLRLYTFLCAALERDGIWAGGWSPDAYASCGYVGQVQQVRPVLDGMERRGLPVDDAVRKGLDVEFDAAQRELDDELQKMVPEEVLGLEPRRGKRGNYSYGYINCPKDTTGLIERDVTELSIDEVTGEPLTVCVRRWCRVVPFNPNSPTQLLAYMRARGHKVPKSRKSENADGSAKDTTEKKELVRLAQRHSDPFYLKVIEYRELSKMRGTYIDGFAPHADGCVHTTFTFDTGTGQLTCCAPWTPVRTPAGHKQIRDIKVGEMVWTHRGRWRRVTDVWVHPKDEMVDVHFSNGYVLTCTTGHRLLLSDHGNQQALANRGEYTESVGDVSERRCSHSAIHLTEVAYFNSHCDLGAVPENVFCGVWSVEKAPLLTLEDGQQEPDDWKGRAAASSLDRTGEGWIRVSDLHSRWQESVRASAGDGTGVGHFSEEVAGDLGSASYRRGLGEQQSRQLGVDDQGRAQIHSLASADGGEVVTIEKIVPVGRFPVHDITVEEDESYATCGVFSHNSRNPNIQNFPKHGRLAKAVRGMIAAPEGYELAEFDYKAYHVLTTGYCAEDADYMRLARLDMHSFVAGHFLHCWDADTIRTESDDELRERFAWFKQDAGRKRVRDKQAKPSILGIGFGMGYRRLYQENLEHFTGEKQAHQFHDLLRHLFPRVFAWQDAIRKQAHEQGFLRSPFGHLRRFYEVYRWDHKKGTWAPGDQAEEAVAFLPANLAFGNIRETMKELARRGLDERYGLVNNVHDSVMFSYRRELRDELLATVTPVLTAPSKVLVHPTLAPQGLSVDVEVNCGPDWSRMEEVKLPARRTDDVAREFNQFAQASGTANSREAVQGGIRSELSAL